MRALVSPELYGEVSPSQAGVKVYGMTMYGTTGDILLINSIVSDIIEKPAPHTRCIVMYYP